MKIEFEGIRITMSDFLSGLVLCYSVYIHTDTHYIYMSVGKGVDFGVDCQKW